MEQIDNELERQERRRGPEIFRAPTIRTLLDIKRALSDLDPARYVTAVEADLRAKLEAADEHGKTVTYGVSATTQPQTKRSILISGFEIIKKRLELQQRAEAETIATVINGVVMKPAFRLQVNGFIWVEPLLKRWLSAYRDGLWVCWDLDDGYTYRYDVFTHKVYRIKRHS